MSDDPTLNHHRCEVANLRGHRAHWWNNVRGIAWWCDGVLTPVPAGPVTPETPDDLTLTLRLAAQMIGGDRSGVTNAGLRSLLRSAADEIERLRAVSPPSPPDAVEVVRTHGGRAMNIDHLPPLGVKAIDFERRRQINQEGWTPTHDLDHDGGELVDAAVCYLRGPFLPDAPPPDDWPWDASAWKPSEDPIRNLVRAGALIAAEIDRIRLVTIITVEADTPTPPADEAHTELGQLDPILWHEHPASFDPSAPVGVPGNDRDGAT